MSSSTITCLISVQNDFDARVTEIEGYFSFLRLIDNNTDDISTSISGHLNKDELLKTLKAGCFLLIYNLMEAATKNSIQGVYDYLRIQGIAYDSCCEAIKKIALKNLKSEKISVANAYSKLSDIVKHILTETFLVENLLSGSVDARSLKSLAEEYGISSRLSTKHSDGSKLLDVKNKRNNLAHGSLTFNEVGRDYTVDELFIIKDNVLVFMQKFIANVDAYLNSREYLDTP